MTADGGLLSESAVKPRRSANKSAASMVSPTPRRNGPASTRAALRRPR